MSINEHRTQNVSIRWTAQQKREQEIALYGGKPEETAMAERQFTAEEIQNMRMIIAQQDKKEGIREFDLNNPPKKQYIHQEFPKMMYRGGEHQVAQTREDEQAALKAGWGTKPGQAPKIEEPEETEEEKALRIEAESLKAENESLRRGPGRPRKE
jgi:hypothetical protein